MCKIIIDYRNYAKDQVMKFNKTIMGDLGEEAINNFQLGGKNLEAFWALERLWLG